MADKGEPVDLDRPANLIVGYYTGAACQDKQNTSFHKRIKDVRRGLMFAGMQRQWIKYELLWHKARTMSCLLLFTKARPEFAGNLAAIVDR